MSGPALRMVRALLFALFIVSIAGLVARNYLWS